MGDRLGMDEVGFGLLTTAMAIGGIIGTVSYGRLERRFSLADIMRVGLVIETLTHLSLALTTSQPVALGTMVVFGAHAFVWGTTSTVVRQRAVPDALLGLLLAEPLLLGRSAVEGKLPSIWRAPLHPDRLPAALGAGLGTALFGVAHALLGLLLGYRPAANPLLLPLGFLAGLGLSLALYGPPWVSWPSSWKGWLPRLGVAGAALALTQWVFVQSGDAGRSLIMVWPGATFRTGMSAWAVPWWQELIRRVPGWFNFLALADAALVGLLLSAGIAVGTRLAGRWLARWQDLLLRAGGV